MYFKKLKFIFYRWSLIKTEMESTDLFIFLITKSMWVDNIVINRVTPNKNTNAALPFLLLAWQTL